MLALGISILILILFILNKPTPDKIKEDLNQ
jgi:hypothetical protein